MPDGNTPDTFMSVILFYPISSYSLPKNRDLDLSLPVPYSGTSDPPPGLLNHHCSLFSDALQRGGHMFLTVYGVGSHHSSLTHAFAG